MTTSELITAYYQQHQAELVAYAAKTLHGDMMTAKDMVQSVFLQLLTSFQLITSATLSSLAYTLLRHQLTDHFRRRQCHQRYAISYTLYADQTASDPFTSYAARHASELIALRIDQLKPQTAQVMRLSILEECPVSAIAKILDINYKKAENQLALGRRQLRAYAKSVVG